MINKDLAEVTIRYNETMNKVFAHTSIKELSLDDLVDCFRGWVQKIQFLSMQKEKQKISTKFAQIAHDAMKKYTLDY